MELTYVLPLRSAEPRYDLTPYLRSLAAFLEVIVVDGSPPEVFDRHAAEWGAPILHLPVAPARASANGKVGGVLTGIDVASHDHVVLADDDVEWDTASLRRVDQLLSMADVVRPQNAYSPLPWHARWDTGRILVNRVFGGDWPGTLAVRRSTLLAAGGYAGDVMFENLELVRSIERVGGRSLLALDLIVRRRPPTVRHLFGQRIRQAYDEFARPHRLAIALLLVPVVARTRLRGAIAIAAGSVAVAEIGRRRSGGRSAFPPTSALWAPAWVAERAVTSWLAVGSRLLSGGIRYRGTVLRRAATPHRHRPTPATARSDRAPLRPDG